MSDSAITPTFKNEYSIKMNEFFMEKNKDDNELKDYELFFEFYDYSCSNFSYWDDGVNAYHEFERKMITARNNKYDMIIVDDRILFNDIALIETHFIEDDFWILKPSLELFTDYAEYIEKNKLNYHDSSILKDGSYENHIYVNDIVKNINDITWKDVLTSLREEDPPYPLTIALGDDDDLINLLMEYASNFYNLSKDYDKNFFNLFYNETGTEFFDSFFNFVMTFSEDNVENSLYLYQDDAFLTFLDGESSFLKAKASHHKVLTTTDDNISATLPPKYTSAITEKYLLINNKSEIKPDILSKIAYQLTSKEMQLFRAKEFGRVPTFDLSQKDSDEDIKSYCQMEPKLCLFIENMKRLNIKELFKSKYSPSYFEIGYMLPQNLRDFIEYNDIQSTIKIFKNIKELTSTGLGAYAVLSYIITAITGIFGYYVMYLVYKYRNHPYIKVVSPWFNMIILFGINMSIFKLVFRLPPYAILKARFFLLYSTLNFNFIYIPMFAITYRIFRIYNSKSVISKSLSNKRLSIVIAVLILIISIYRSIISFTDNMYYMGHGCIENDRFPMYEYVEYDNDHLAYEYYMYAIFMVLNLFISATGKKARKFGSSSYTFIVFFLNIHDYVSEEIILYLDAKHFGITFLFTAIYNCLVCILCIYLLVGCRILYVKLNPNLKVNNQMDLKEFVGLELTKMGISSAKNRLKRLSSIVSYNRRVSKQSTLNNSSNPSNPSTVVVSNSYSQNSSKP
ncbi:hypothetical protein BCR32DRAFT_280198 [Anaeromyces robustus]|uniref:G-protein coupled receptors family 3 profile domain-containing protein n=1 Tax=Anaeromyces robustus TaxID=1754192 RepID=A0A1Y1X4T8_9FUNG|nr:hypothetical protein BCR32DRAFT_280198 [Anaeromyces robustus]|eukprot:ORX80827.1 hypothetical protein BCR32DRAFT_280198 [Anaeromyces robustus]